MIIIIIIRRNPENSIGSYLGPYIKCQKSFCQQPGATQQFAQDAQRIVRGHDLRHHWNVFSGECREGGAAVALHEAAKTLNPKP